MNKKLKSLTVKIHNAKSIHKIFTKEEKDLLLKLVGEHSLKLQIEEISNRINTKNKNNE